MTSDGPHLTDNVQLSRRSLLAQASVGFGSLAMASTLAQTVPATSVSPRTRSISVPGLWCWKKRASSASMCETRSPCSRAATPWPTRAISTRWPKLASARTEKTPMMASATQTRAPRSPATST